MLLNEQSDSELHLCLLHVSAHLRLYSNSINVLPVQADQIQIFIQIGPIARIDRLISFFFIEVITLEEIDKSIDKSF